MLQHEGIQDATVAVCKMPARRDIAQPADVVAPERALAEHQFETVMVGRVVGCGDHHPTVGVERMDAIIQHRCWAQPNADGIDAAGIETFDYGALTFR